MTAAVDFGWDDGIEDEDDEDDEDSGTGSIDPSEFTTQDCASAVICHSIQ
jgi:hypothetical protein